MPSFIWRDLADRTEEDPSYITNVDPFQALAPGQTRTTSFTYTAVDAAGREVSATVDLDVAGVNDAPVALDFTGHYPWNRWSNDYYFTLYAVDLDSDVFAIGITQTTSSGFVLGNGAPGYTIDYPNDPYYGIPYLLIEHPPNPHPEIDWYQAFARDIYTQGALFEYHTFLSTFTGFDSITYVATDDRTLTTYSAPATFGIQIFEV